MEKKWTMESEVKYGDKTMTNSISHGKLKDEIHIYMVYGFKIMINSLS
jgi:hypothetical protein